MNGVSVEGMEEFKVQSSSYSAEFGRTSNGVINWVTKSGTNQFHGSAFMFNRNEVFNARGFTIAPSKRPIVRQWNPGGSLGGPIYIPKVFDGRNKAFFFFAYERASTRNGQSTALVNAPLRSFRPGTSGRCGCSGGTIPLYDPFDADGSIIPNSADRPLLQCNGVPNVICPNRIDPTAKLLVGMLPHPDDPTKLTANYRSRSYSTSRQWLPSIKGDYVFNDKHRVSYLFSHFRSPATPSINQFEGLPGSGFPSESLDEYHRLNDDYIISPTLLNHLTIGFNHRHVLEAPESVNTFPVDLAQQIYLKGNPNALIPGVSTVYGADGAHWGNTVFTDSRQRTTNIKEQTGLDARQPQRQVRYGIPAWNLSPRLEQQHLGQRELQRCRHRLTLDRKQRKRSRIDPARCGERRQLPLSGRHGFPLALLCVVRAGRLEGIAKAHDQRGSSVRDPDSKRRAQSAQQQLLPHMSRGRVRRDSRSDGVRRT